MKSSLGISNFLEKISSLSHSVVFSTRCIDHWGRLSYLSLLFFGTLHSDACIFPFLLCFSPLFFSQLFVRPPQTGILPFCISFPWGWSSLPPVQCHEPHSIVHQALYLSDLGRVGFKKIRSNWVLARLYEFQCFVNSKIISKGLIALICQGMQWVRCHGAWSRSNWIFMCAFNTSDS